MLGVHECLTQDTTVAAAERSLLVWELLERRSTWRGRCACRPSKTSRLSLRRIYDEKPDALRLELAAMLDMRTLVSKTYELEGDRLEVLLHCSSTNASRCCVR